MPNEPMPPVNDMEAMAERAREAAAWIKAIANENRLMVLCALVAGEASVGELNSKVPLSQSALSQHLATLRRENLVVTRRQGQTIFYSLADERVLLLMQTLYNLFCPLDSRPH